MLPAVPRLTPGKIVRMRNLRPGASTRPPWPLGQVQRIALRLLRKADGPIGTVEVQSATHRRRRRAGRPLVGGCRSAVIRALDRFADRLGRGVLVGKSNSNILVV
jgi:hypothetical protein